METRRSMASAVAVQRAGLGADRGGSDRHGGGKLNRSVAACSGARPQPVGFVVDAESVPALRRPELILERPIVGVNDPAGPADIPGGRQRDRRRYLAGYQALLEQRVGYFRTSGHLAGDTAAPPFTDWLRRLSHASLTNSLTNHPAYRSSLN